MDGITDKKDAGEHSAQMRGISHMGTQEASFRESDAPHRQQAAHHQEKLAAHRDDKKEQEHAIWKEHGEGGHQTKSASRGADDRLGEGPFKERPAQSLEKAADNTTGEIQMQKILSPQDFFDAASDHEDDEAVDQDVEGISM